MAATGSAAKGTARSPSAPRRGPSERPKASPPGRANEDGRKARRDSNQKAVMDSLLGFWREGVLTPEVSIVAERAGVSERSVFRYFDDVLALQKAVIQRQLEQEAGLFDAPTTSGDLEERIHRFIGLRLEQYEVLSPVARVAFTQAPFDTNIQREIARRRDQIRSQARYLFGEELRQLERGARVEVVAAVEMAVSFEAIEYLRTARGMTPYRAAGVLERILGSLLGAE